MAEQTVDFNDIFNKNVIIGMQQMLQLLNDMETATKNLAKTKIKTDGGAAAVKENEKAIQESLKTQKLLMDIQKKKEVISKQQTLTLKELNELMKKETRTIQELKEKNNQLAQARNNVDKSSVKGKQLFDDLTKSISKNTAELKKLDKEVGNFQRNVGNYPKVSEFFGGLLAAGGIGVGVSGLVDLGKEIFNVTAKFEKYNAMLVQTLGSQEDATSAMNLIKDIAKSTPFSVDELTNSYIKLKNRGIDPTKETILAFGDIASSTGKSFDQFAEAVLDAQTFQFERLKEFGITAKKEGDNIKFTFKGQTTEVGKTSDEITRYLTELGKVKGISGSMAAISNTLEGKISNLGDAWDGLLLSFGKSGMDDVTKKLVEFTTEVINSFEKGNALTESISALWNRFSEFLTTIKDLYTLFIPFNKEVSGLENIFKILSTTLDISLIPFKALMWVGKEVNQIIIWLIENVTPLNELFTFTSEILGQVVTAVKATNEEMKSLVITNQKFGQVSKAVYDLLSITIASLTEVKIKQFEFGEATKEATKLTKEQEESLKNLEKQLIATSEQFGKSLAGELITKERAKDLLEPINNELLNIVKVGKKVGIELKNGLIAGFNEAGTVEEFNFEELYSALNDLKSNGLELFSEINSANQERTENAISESEKRIEALQSEYENEKSLQEQRKKEGKRYDESRLNELNKSIAAEGEAKARQEEQLKKFQKRQLITQIIADEASALSSAIVAAFGNPANKFTFGAAGIVQLAAMTVQLTSAFLKVRGALEKFEDGGLVGGELHRNGGTIIEAEKGEYITNRKATANSRGLLEAVNSGKITDKHLQLLINPIPNNTQTNIFDTKNVESLLSEQISVNRSGFGKLENSSYIEHGFRVVKKNGLTTRYK